MRSTRIFLGTLGALAIAGASYLAGGIGPQPYSNLPEMPMEIPTTYRVTKKPDSLKVVLLDSITTDLQSIPLLRNREPITFLSEKENLAFITPSNSTGLTNIEWAVHYTENNHSGRALQIFRTDTSGNYELTESLDIDIDGILGEQ